jgi:hypothetical protein
MSADRSRKVKAMWEESVFDFTCECMYQFCGSGSVIQSFFDPVIPNPGPGYGSKIRDREKSRARIRDPR